MIVIAKKYCCECLLSFFHCSYTTTHKKIHNPGTSAGTFKTLFTLNASITETPSLLMHWSDPNCDTSALHLHVYVNTPTLDGSYDPLPLIANALVDRTVYCVPPVIIATSGAGMALIVMLCVLLKLELPR